MVGVFLGDCRVAVCPWVLSLTEVCYLLKVYVFQRRAVCFRVAAQFLSCGFLYGDVRRDSGGKST